MVDGWYARIVGFLPVGAGRLHACTVGSAGVVAAGWCHCSSIRRVSLLMLMMQVKHGSSGRAVVGVPCCPSPICLQDC